jgi:hypothetical protein
MGCLGFRLEVSLDLRSGLFNCFPSKPVDSHCVVVAVYADGDVAAVAASALSATAEERMKVVLVVVMVVVAVVMVVVVVEISRHH